MRTSKWRTLRVVVEYRTQRDTSEKDLRSAVQYLLDNSHGLTMEQFGESRLWVKGFNAFLANFPAMPVITVNKDGNLLCWKDYIRAARQARSILPIAEAHRVKMLA